MDSECNKSEEGDKQKKNSDPLPGTGTILQSSGIRRSICINDGDDRKLLGYGYNILLYYGIVSWVIFLLFKN